MTPDFRLLEILKRFEIPYVIVGGLAVNAHGYICGTEGTDLLWLRSEIVEVKLLAALEEIKAEYIGNEIDPNTGIERTYPVTASFVQSKSLMMLCTQFGFLDLFDYVPGFPQTNVEEVIESAIELNGLRFVSLSWLRRMKKKPHRGQGTFSILKTYLRFKRR